MPSGTLTHMMDVVTIKEGDTNLVKMSKLAQIRQIMEGGLEPILEDPQVDPQSKEYAKTLLDRAKEAVPFTQQDVVRLINGKPGTRLQDFMGKQKRAAPAKTAPSQRMTATNPKTGERIESTDGGKTWHPLK
jgi:hypothetical protein